MKKILTIQDLSCVGQCSLTVALPILSRFGIETCVLPTAILSNHTMFKSWSYLDLTPELTKIFKEWSNNNFNFDCFLFGYLGKLELMKISKDCIKKFSNTNSKVIIDPVFADNGKIYPGFDENYPKEMAKFIKVADIILPNVSEACFMTNCEYKEKYDKNYIQELVFKLKKLTNATIIITGVELNGKIGEVIYNNDMFEYVLLKKLPTKYHGTGDIFSSVFTANYLNGKTLKKSCLYASKFVINCIKNTDKNHFYGVNFEKILKK